MPHCSSSTATADLGQSDAFQQGCESGVLTQDVVGRRHRDRAQIWPPFLDRLVQQGKCPVTVAQGGLGAEIHALVRSKRDPIPGRLDEQLTKFEGGCDVNECSNVQGAAHVGGALDTQGEMIRDILDFVRRIAGWNGLLFAGE